MLKFSVENYAQKNKEDNVNTETMFFDDVAKAREWQKSQILYNVLFSVHYLKRFPEVTIYVIPLNPRSIPKKGILSRENSFDCFRCTCLETG